MITSKETYIKLIIFVYGFNLFYWYLKKKTYIRKLFLLNVIILVVFLASFEENIFIPLQKIKQICLELTNAQKLDYIYVIS